jgi:hypothetical protein
MTTDDRYPRLAEPHQLSYGEANARTLQITEVIGPRSKWGLSLLGPGMGLIVDLKDVFDGKLRVPLGS